MSPKHPFPLLNVRSALVLLIALVVGVLSGGLGWLATANIAGAMLVGGGAAGGAVALFHNLLSR